MEFLAAVPEVATADESRYSAIIAIMCQIANLVSSCVNTSIVIALKLWTLEWRDDDVLTPTVLQEELVDLQKVPAAAADSCVFSGLTAGSLYRLQVVSWSRGLSSDSAVLARTGQSRSANQQPPGLHDDDDDEDDDYHHASSSSSSSPYSSSSSCASSAPAPVSSLELQSSGRTDRLTANWQPGGGSWSSYQVTPAHFN